MQRHLSIRVKRTCRTSDRKILDKILSEHQKCCFDHTEPYFVRYHLTFDTLAEKREFVNFIKNNRITAEIL